MQELRELNTKLEYEKSQLSDEGRRLDKIEDKIVGKDNVLKGMVREVGMVNQENVVMHKTEVSLERALKTTTDVAESGEGEVSERAKPFFAFFCLFEFSNCCADDPDLDRPCTNPSHKKMRLAEPATVSNFELLKPPYVGVPADSVIRPILLI